MNTPYPIRKDMMMKLRTMLLGLVSLVILIQTQVSWASEEQQTYQALGITVLYDNYTLTESCKTKWGFSCLIKGFDKCILFDTGGEGDLLLENMDKLNVRAQDIDLIVISHHHWDHIGGLTSFLNQNSDVTVYLPSAGEAETVPSIEATGAQVCIVNEPMELCPGVHLTGPLTEPIIEQSLVIETPQGPVLVTGCSHPGIVRIIEKAKVVLDQDVYFVFGGFHLGSHSTTQVGDIVRQMKTLGVRKVGATHCTGDQAINLFKQEYGSDFVPIGVGQIELPID